MLDVFRQKMPCGSSSWNPYGIIYTLPVAQLFHSDKQEDFIKAVRAMCRDAVCLTMSYIIGIL